MDQDPDNAASVLEEGLNFANIITGDDTAAPPAEEVKPTEEAKPAEEVKPTEEKSA